MGRASTLQRTGTINVFETHFGIWEEPTERNIGVFWPPMMRVFRALRGLLYRRGWRLVQEPGVHPRIRKGHYLGRKGDLEAVVEYAGRHIKVEFFQNVANVENTHGGRYDFGKLARMPRTMRLQCIVEMTALVRWALQIGYVPGRRGYDSAALRFSVAEPLARNIKQAMEDRPWREGDTPLDVFNRTWGEKRFRRDETGWPTDAELGPYNRRDRDGAMLRNGDIRYFYDCRSRRLLRGRVFTSMNNMWMVHAMVDGVIAKVANFELFSLDGKEPLPLRLPIQNQAARLEAELARETKAKNWPRVRTLGDVLARMSARSG